VTARHALLGCLLLALCVTAAEAAEDHHGWGYLVDKLIADGVEPARVVAAFEDPRMEPFDGLEFGLAPRDKAEWWTRLQEVPLEERGRMADGLTGAAGAPAGPRRRGRRRRRRRGTSAPA